MPETESLPIGIMPKTATPGAVGVIGPESVLRAAYETGEPVTLTGKLSGEQVWLGHARRVMGDGGVTVETIGLDRMVGETERYPGVPVAVYLIDTTRLDRAPQFAEAHRKALDRRAQRAAEMEARIAVEDERLEGPAEDGA